MDLVQVGSRVTGELMTRSHLVSDLWAFLFVLGRVDADTLWLGPDTTRAAYPPDAITFKGVMQADGGMSADYRLPELRLTAHADLSSVPVGAVAVELQRGIGESLQGLAFDGVHVWAGTSISGFPRYDQAGDEVGRVYVNLYPGIMWSSGPLAANDTLLYGHQHVTVVSPGGTRKFSDIIEFDHSGEIQRRYSTTHVTTSLTHDGTRLWSLGADSDTLYALDSDGVPVQEIPLSVPDFVAVETDGTDFWFVGWQLPVLYRMSPAGEILGVWDFPAVEGWQPMVGLASEGPRGARWWATRSGFVGTLLYRFTVPQ